MMPADKTVSRLIGAGSAVLRQRDDYYATPEVCTERLLDAEARALRKRNIDYIWEPACGEGHISRVLERRGFMTHSSDLVNRGYGYSGIDFLNLAETHKILMGISVRLEIAPAIITNPPFSLAADFVRQAFRLRAPLVIMLLKLSFLEGVGRADLIEDCYRSHGYSLTRVHVFKNRVSLLKNGLPHKGGMLAFAWFVWEPLRQDCPDLYRMEIR